MISKNMNDVINSLNGIAKNLKHDIVSTEHLLMGVIQNNDGKKVIKECGGNIDSIYNELAEHLKTFEHSNNQKMEISPVLNEIIMNGLKISALSQNPNGQIVLCDIPHMLLSILLSGGEDMFARYILVKNGITELKIKQYLSHGPELETVGGGETSNGPQKQKTYLEHFTVNLSERAKDGKIDKLIGRDQEIDRMVHILSRRKKNNPVLVGNAGVGKTALAEGLALRIFKKEVPKPLQDFKIYSLNMGTLMAGTKFRGDLEERIDIIVKDVSKQKNAILFIDEIHTIVGSGSGSNNNLDTSNMLKPHLVSGDIRIMGSTTYEEYKSIEKDSALKRRFQKIDVREPNINETTAILVGLKKYYEDYHKVKYNLGIIDLMCNLAHKHINEAFLPDKAVDVMDECGALVKLRVDGKRSITENDVREVITKMTNIPLENLDKNETNKFKNLKSKLKERIFGQNEAIDKITKSIIISQSGLSEPNKPIASFLFTGPTGSGKTEVCKQTADLLGVKLLRYDMSEYMEKHSVAKLIGSPPGYVGHEQGGQLTDDVRKNPNCIIVLDEFEKAHNDIFNIFLQVLDYGTLTDGTGRKTDFSNAIIIMTSNAGSTELSDSPVIGFHSDEKKDNKEKIDKTLHDTFKPEFRNRLDGMVNFNHLGKSVINKIVKKFINELNDLLKEKKVKISVDNEVIKYLGIEGYDKKMGARPIKRVIHSKLKEVIANEIVFGKLINGGKVKITLKSGKLNFDFGKQK